ncbi:transcriptional regulator [Halodesulfovibrio sp.]|uniref:transcriptional regulator n=1 Tax=Halodesulfovibrio sp. TaxID=1912772 RepID=UPI0025EF28F7|nr:transcriptional regulator [Halodesulfovibrio sp.]MCT4534867.1 transcriptional regulator [Halodesulfovibrio sp.]MCT4627820.1 transcriptional regulator [Halodesulfovibrio sp.]
MIKWVVLLVCGWLLFKLVTNDNKKKADKKQKDMEKKVATGDMVKDPVCGAFVSLDQDIRIRDGETIHRFCSYECRDKFLARLEESGRAISKESKEEPAD